MDKFPKYDYYHYLNFIYNFIWYINYYILQQQIMASFGDDSLLLNIKTNIKKKP